MNFTIIIFFYLIIDIFGKTRKIIGGTNADIKDFPFMVSFRIPTGNEHFCGGTIISKQHILTAAHCLYSRQEYYLIIRIYIGTSSSWNVSVPYYEISQVTIHPDYLPTSPINGNYNDISIIKVGKYIKFNEFQQAGVLPTEDIHVGNVVLTIGWGLVEYPSTFYMEELQKLSTTIIDNDDCETQLQLPISQGHICTFKRTGAGGCLGDSGSPLIFNGIIIGIYSFSMPCAIGYPDVFTRLYPFMNFINSVLKK